MYMLHALCDPRRVWSARQAGEIDFQRDRLCAAGRNRRLEVPEGAPNPPSESSTLLKYTAAITSFCATRDARSERRDPQREPRRAGYDRRNRLLGARDGQREERSEKNADRAAETDARAHCGPRPAKNDSESDPP